MAGHSKWANIKHKNKTDAQRAKIFKAWQEIQVAVREVVGP